METYILLASYSGQMLALEFSLLLHQMDTLVTGERVKRETAQSAWQFSKLPKPFSIC